MTSSIDWETVGWVLGILISILGILKYWDVVLDEDLPELPDRPLPHGICQEQGCLRPATHQGRATGQKICGAHAARRMNPAPAETCAELSK